MKKLLMGLLIGSLNYLAAAAVYHGDFEVISNPNSPDPDSAVRASAVAPPHLGDIDLENAPAAASSSTLLPSEEDERSKATTESIGIVLAEPDPESLVKASDHIVQGNVFVRLGNWLKMLMGWFSSFF